MSQREKSGSPEKIETASVRFMSKGLVVLHGRELRGGGASRGDLAGGERSLPASRRDGGDIGAWRAGEPPVIQRLPRHAAHGRLQHAHRHR